MKSIQIVFMIFLFINGYLFYESNNDEEERSKYRRQSNSDDEAEILKYKPKDKTTTKSLKRRNQPYSQNSSDEEKEVLEYKPEGFRSESRWGFLNPSSTTTTKSSYNQSTTTRDIMLLIKSRLRSHFLRREEFFNTYLNWPQIKYNTGDHIINKFSRDNITRLLGRGNHLLVYDCQNPSYIIRNRKKRMFLSLIIELASSSNCTNSISTGRNIGINALWLRGGQSYNPVTYDLKTRKLSKPPLPMYDLIMYFYQLGLCEEFMMFMGHPYYYIENSIRPYQCDGIVT